MDGKLEKALGTIRSTGDPADMTVENVVRGDMLDIPAAYPAANWITDREKGRNIVAQKVQDALTWYNAKPPKTDDECEERVLQFFETCVKNDFLPTMEKAALALGVPMATLRSWAEGSMGARRSQIISRIFGIISAADTDAALVGAISSDMYKFRAKNFYNMSDEQKIVFRPDEGSREERAEALSEDVYLRLQARIASDEEEEEDE